MSIDIISKLKHLQHQPYISTVEQLLSNFAWTQRHSWNYSKLHDTILPSIFAVYQSSWERDFSLRILLNRHFATFGNSRGGGACKRAAFIVPAYIEHFSVVVSMSTQTHKPTSIHANMHKILTADVLLLLSATELYGKLLTRILYGDKLSSLLGRIIS